MAAFATFPQQDSFGSSHGSSRQPNGVARSGSSVSIIGGEESFLQHTMVRDVLALYTAGASVVDNRTGKLPIVLAVENGKSWETAVGPLLDAFPKPFAGGGDGECNSIKNIHGMNKQMNHTHFIKHFVTVCCTRLSFVIDL
jgi:hypothetical protein